MRIAERNSELIHRRFTVLLALDLFQEVFANLRRHPFSAEAPGKVHHARGFPRETTMETKGHFCETFYSRRRSCQ